MFRSLNLAENEDNVCFDFREHDQDIELTGSNEEVTTAPSVEEQEEIDKTHELFLKLAGEDMEVDWCELKDVLDFAMRNDLPPSKGKSKENRSCLQTTPNSNYGFTSAIIGLLCTKFCQPALSDANETDCIELTSNSQETKQKGFSEDLCRSMIALLDNDRSGMLGYQEFKKLWSDVRNWKAAFKQYDSDGSGALSGFELRIALNSAGYRVNNHMLNILVHRFGNKHSEIYFEDFILCAAKIKAMIELFKKKDENRDKKAEFTLEEWIETTLYS